MVEEPRSHRMIDLGSAPTRFSGRSVWMYGPYRGEICLRHRTYLALQGIVG